MIKNKIIVLVVLLYSSFVFAQKGTSLLVEYEKHLILPDDIYTEFLFVEANKSFYVADSLTMKEHNSKRATIDPDNDSHIIIGGNQRREPSKFYKKDLLKNIILYEDAVDFNQKNYIIADSLPQWDWKLIPNETKKIGNYLCNKAETEFRGSQIVAYYTTEIPINAGPWKFSGLPGLILEVREKDTTNNSWIATKINYPYKEKTLNLSFKKETNLISLKQFVKITNDYWEEDWKQTLARIPKDVIVKKINKGKVIKTIEKKYEWEEPQTK